MSLKVLGSIKAYVKMWYTDIFILCYGSRGSCTKSEVTQWLCCIVGNVGARSLTAVYWSAMHSDNTVGHIVDILETKWSKSMQQNQRYHAYITHNATWPLSDITRGNLSDYMQLHLEPQEVLSYLFRYAVVLFTCSHTLISKIVPWNTKTKPEKGSSRCHDMLTVYSIYIYVKQSRNVRWIVCISL